MSASVAPSDRRALVARLRAAGCVYAEDEARLLVAEAASAAELEAMVDRRESGLPLEHILGWAQFCGVRIVVEPGVFVPRRRTEFLVQLAVAGLRDAGGAVGQAPPVVALDLCCGSGAVGAALAAALGAAALGQVELYAVDVDPVAVRCARGNLAAAGGQVFEGDLYDPLSPSLRGRVTVLVANAPYVPTEEMALMAPEARLHERPVALDGGADGLDVLRRVITAAPGWLTLGGRLLVETSDRQASAVLDCVVRAGLVADVVHSAETNATVVTGIRSAALD